jgi:hypothetical protein
MKSFLAVSVALLVATSAFGAASTSRTIPNMGPAGSVPGSPAPDGPADVLIASSTDGGTFTDLGPKYAAALTAAGASSVTTITDGTNAPFTFPVPFTSAEFGTVVILTNENWFGPAGGGGGLPESNCSLQDETRIAAYMDTGGHMLFSGQDYLFARGNGNGFPQIYLGIASHTDDINFGDTNITYSGTAGGALAGRSGSLVIDGNPCWTTANQFFSDDVTSFGATLVNYNSQPTNVNGQGGTTWDAGAFRTVFSALELACTSSTNQFNGDVAAIYTFLQGSATSVEPKTWGEIKNMFSER